MSVSRCATASMDHSATANMHHSATASVYSSWQPGVMWGALRPPGSLGTTAQLAAICQLGTKACPPPPQPGSPTCLDHKTLHPNPIPPHPPPLGDPCLDKKTALRLAEWACGMENQVQVLRPVQDIFDQLLEQHKWVGWGPGARVL